MQLGDIELTFLSDGAFRLDGGAMFGIVPKPAWERRIPADERNRIRLALRPLLIRTRDAAILVDTGMGEKWDAKSIDVYGLETSPPRLVQTLKERAGLAPEDVTHVVLTHLHFDHAGGTTRWVRPPAGDVAGEAALVFPRAQYVVQRGEWAVANAPDPRSRGSYRPEDFAPIAAAKRLQLIEGDTELVPGVRAVMTQGHTRSHQGVEIRANGDTAFYFGDLIPTAAHLDPAWVMGYDCYPTEAATLKATLVERAVAERWLVCFDHDPSAPGGRVVKDGRRYRLEPIA